MFDNANLQKNTVDHLYIDNTFCHPIFQMPPRVCLIPSLLLSLTPSLPSGDEKNQQISSHKNGAIVHMVERFLSMEEVRGSIPLSSIFFLIFIFFFFQCNIFLSRCLPSCFFSFFLKHFYLTLFLGESTTADNRHYSHAS